MQRWGILLGTFIASAAMAQSAANPQQPGTAAQTTPSGAGSTSAPVSGSTPAATAPTQQPSATPSAKGEATEVKQAQQGNDDQPPSTTLYNSGNNGAIDTESLLKPGPLPKSKVALVGGRVKSIDHIRNRMTVTIFGSNKKMKLGFDERSRFYRDGREVTQMQVKPGDRVYLDTQLDDGALFAKDVHVDDGLQPADARGQVTRVDPHHGSITVADSLSARPVTFSVSNTTEISNQGQKSTIAQLRPGSIVTVQFMPGSANRGLAHKINVIAAPGQAFTFYGRVSHIDLSRGLLSVENPQDNNIYDVHFTPATARVDENWKVGNDATVQAMFNGRDYVAESIVISPAVAAKGDDEDSLTDSDKALPNSDQDQKQDKKDKKHKKDKKKDKDKDQDDDIVDPGL